MFVLDRPVTEVMRRHCGDKHCRNAGRLGHYAHSPCKAVHCLDQGISHSAPHRVQAPPERTSLMGHWWGKNSGIAPAGQEV